MERLLLDEHEKARPIRSARGLLIVADVPVERRVVIQFHGTKTGFNCITVSPFPS